MNRHIHRIINRGIKEDDSIEVRRQIGLLNTATLCSFVTISFFMVVNILNHKWILLANNIVLFLLTVSLLYISRLKFFNLSIIILCILFTLYFFADALLFQNALQYAIPVMMVVSVLLVHSNTWRIVLLSLQIGLFMTYVFRQDQPGIIPPLPAYRNYITTFSMLIILALMLQYFKRKQLQYIKNLSTLNAKLQESNQVKERMLSILSHDFNAPVANLVSTLNLVDAEVLTPKQFNDISIKLQTQLNVLVTSLGDVLHWSKMQISGDKDSPSTVNIKVLLDEVILLFQYAIDEKYLNISNTVDAGAAVFVNKENLKLIFRNLLSNAIKFSFPGKSIIISSIIQDGRIYISIQDEGTGMPPGILSSLQQENIIFKTTTGTANEKGTGIGLMLVREFLQKTNGTLTIESVYGKGSTFTVALPLNITAA